VWQLNDPLDEFEEIRNTRSFSISQSKLTQSGWQLESGVVLSIMDKLRNVGKPLTEHINGKFYSGIKTGLNEAFVVDQPTYDRLVAEHKSSAKILMPFLRGRDVKRWRIDYSDYYIIKFESSENARHLWTGKSLSEGEKIFAESYPAIYSYMKPYKKALIERDDQGKYYWELRSCAYWGEFLQPKIIYPDIAQRAEFSYDTSGYHIGNTMYMLPTKDLWLLAVLNSKLLYWFYTKLSSQIQNGFVRFIAQFVSQIPIATPANPKKLESLVTKILAAKRADPRGDTSALEEEIDQLVYQLYGLTQEEIDIVEGK
jgi:adenine-specific DNA-methyltransferase